jgi:hypothetical protein
MAQTPIVTERFDTATDEWVFTVLPTIPASTQEFRDTDYLTARKAALLFVQDNLSSLFAVQPPSFWLLTMQF